MYQVDKDAPKFNKTPAGYLTADFGYILRWFVSEQTTEDKKKVPNQSVMRSFMYQVAEEIWEKIIKEAWVCKLPSGLGNIYVYETYGSNYNNVTKPKMTRYIDWKETRKQGRHVFKYNLHSDGIKHRLTWDKTLCRFKNYNLYDMSFYRGSSDKAFGQRGINYWVRKCSEDPKIENYRSNIKH